MVKLLTLFIVAALSLTWVAIVYADMAKGEGGHMNFCASCHDSGIAGAPKVGHRTTWNERSAKGLAAMIQNAINGFKGKSGIMAAKGGNRALNDDEVSAAVIYMLSKSK